MAKLDDLLVALGEVRKIVAKNYGLDCNIVREIDFAVRTKRRDDLTRAVRSVRREERVMGNGIDKFRKMCALADQVLADDSVV